MKSNSLGDRLTPAINRIEKLSTVQRVLIYLVTFLLLGGGVGYFSYWPKFQRLEQLKAEFEELEAKLIVARRTAAQLPKLRQELAEAESRFKTVQRALPETEEIPSLLASVSQSGRDLGLDFLLFEPKAEVNREFYAEIPVSIRVQGSYHGVGLFLDRVAHLPRIVNVFDINMVPGERKTGAGGSLVTSCTATTYKFVETPPPQDPKKIPPKPKR
jgi:type IV pilus assembly protein PilO